MIAAGAVVLVAAAIAGTSAWSSAGAADVEQVGRAFDGDPDWTRIAEKTRGNKLLCLDGGGCPHYVTSWSLPEPLNPARFQQLVDDAGFGFAVVGLCVNDPNGVGSQIGCTADGTADGYSVEIAYRTPSSSQEPGRVTLEVRPSLS